ncbi:hypothetical protein C5748_18410 [Phyllobacterium phragmitis]|uniref:Uncharacterized protein n=1 Tax=Phyllobacterium phragmitis TaxID=2670329 RepID=A0A2S9INM1_9HYPH|nr:hypothetical protein [Phyllobacterium phragmitis]PRD42123.1 hypothetical protein C5748_18410 [Phyllobacterium phragmitis]
MANSNAGSKFYCCVTPQPTDLTQAEFEALTWVEVKNVGSVGETGLNTNVLTYDTLDTDVSQKSKGISNAGDPAIEVARVAADPGQMAMRTIAATRYYYPFKLEKADAPTALMTNTIVYNRGLITGPTRPNGRNEDFDLEIFTLGLVQKEVVVDPATI